MPTDTLATDSLDVVFQSCTVGNGREVRGYATGLGFYSIRETYVSDMTVGAPGLPAPRAIPVPRCFRNGSTSDTDFAIARREWDTARTVAHEIGHALSLGHAPGDSLIMGAVRSGRAFTETEISAMRAAAIRIYPHAQLGTTSSPRCTLPGSIPSK